jgi:Pentapeptide repeats (8 copies)
MITLRTWPVWIAPCVLGAAIAHAEPVRLTDGQMENITAGSAQGILQSIRPVVAMGQSGFGNTGQGNVGHFNSGDNNVGAFNTGDNNRGSFNGGDGNVGAFNGNQGGKDNFGDFNGNSNGNFNVGDFNGSFNGNSIGNFSVRIGTLVLIFL